MTPPADLEAAAAQLYAGPREDFIATRAQLVKAAKAAGDAGLAARIAALAKPAATAWAVDRLWWDAPEHLHELFAAASELRATLAAGAGTLGAEPLRVRHRRALSAATTAALERLPGTATITTRRRIATTLEALGALGRWPTPGPGCLAEDLDPPGFEAAGALPALVTDGAEVPQAGANDGAHAALAAAMAAVRHAAARHEVCRDQHDALVAAHREALAQVEDAAAALRRANAHHEATVAAERATKRDLDQREAELAEAAAALALAQAALAAITDTR